MTAISAAAVILTIAYLHYPATMGFPAARNAPVSSTPRTTRASDDPSPVALACGAFRRAAATAATSLSPGGELSTAAISTLGNALLDAADTLSNATPDPDAHLASDLGLAATASLAIADNFLPAGAAAAYHQATYTLSKVGTDCTALGY